MSSQIERAQLHSQALRNASAAEVAAWAVETFKGGLTIASSFGAEDVVLIDLFYRADNNVRIFTLDTGRLHDETYEVMDKIRKHYPGLNLEVYFPNQIAVQNLTRDKGFFSFRDSIDNRKECCNIRKVEPLQRALNNADAWVTGLRREQSVTRGDLQKVEVGGPGHPDICKINPLLEWSEEDVWDYIRDFDVPYNALHDKDFPSIGCAPCTRAILSGEDVRAGRWWWESPDTRECGLHPTPRKKAS